MLRARRRWVILPAISVIAGCSLLASSEFGDFQGGAGADAGTAANDSSPGADTSCATCADAGTTIATDATADATSTADGGAAGPTTLVFQRTDGGTLVADTTIREGSPTTTGGGDPSLQADFIVSGAGGSAIVLMRFDLSSIASGSKVSAATLTLNITDQTSGTTPFLLYPLLRSWSEAEATWNLAANGVSWNFPGTRTRDAGTADRKVTSIASLRPLTPGVLDVPLDATGIAQLQTWIDDPKTNFGFAFDTNDNSDAVIFTSSESNMPPRLTITFTPPGADGG